MYQALWALFASVGAVVGLRRWYHHEQTQEADALVHFQSEHDHFHLHVDLPSGMEVAPGDTLHILALPEVQGQTQGEITYPSRVRLRKASWLKRTMVKRSSLVEINELVEHP